MYRLITIFASLLFVTKACTQNAAAVNQELNEISKITELVTPSAYKLYATENMWTFLELDTATSSRYSRRTSRSTPKMVWWAQSHLCATSTPSLLVKPTRSRMIPTKYTSPSGRTPIKAKPTMPKSETKSNMPSIPVV